jgi:pimeloyl-ACP methyl ester carboxylesterase
VQHAIANSGSHQAIYALDCADAGAIQRVDAPDPWLPAGSGARERYATGLGRARNGSNAPIVAAAMHHCFEGVDTGDILPGIHAPVLLLSGDKSQISSDQQKVSAEALPNSRLQLFAGYGHGVNLLLPEQCARTALAFWDPCRSRPCDCNRNPPSCRSSLPMDTAGGHKAQTVLRDMRVSRGIIRQRHST